MKQTKKLRSPEEKNKKGGDLMVIEVKKSLSESVIKEYRGAPFEKTNKGDEDENKRMTVCNEEIPITPELVAFELYAVYLKCMQEIPVLTKDKETGKQVPTGVYQFDARSALKALQLLGDAVGLFKDKSTTPTQTQTYEDFLKSGGFDYEF